MAIPPNTVNFQSYAGGGQVLAATLGGNRGITVGFASEFRYAILRQEVRPLAISSLAPLTELPVRPIAETLHTNFDTVSWTCLFAPAGIDGAALALHRSQARAVANSPRWLVACRDNDQTADYLDPELMSAFLEIEDAAISQDMKDLRRRSGP